MSHFTGLLRQITKKASNPNALVYKIQLERAKQKYLVQGQLGDAEGAVMLSAPEGKPKEGEEKETERSDDRGVTEVATDGEEGHGEDVKKHAESITAKETTSSESNRVHVSEPNGKEKLPGGSKV